MKKCFYISFKLYFIQTVLKFSPFKEKLKNPLTTYLTIDGIKSLPSLTGGGSPNGGEGIYWGFLQVKYPPSHGETVTAPFRQGGLFLCIFTLMQHLFFVYAAQILNSDFICLISSASFSSHSSRVLAYTFRLMRLPYTLGEYLPSYKRSLSLDIQPVPALRILGL